MAVTKPKAAKKTKAKPKVLTAKTGGRPKLLKADKATLDKIHELAMHGCIQQEMADELNVSLSTFERFLREDPNVRVAMRRGNSKGCAALRKAKYDAAIAGDRTMMVWESKQRLGESDKASLTVTPPDLSKLTTEEIEALIAIQDKLAGSNNPA